MRTSVSPPTANRQAARVGINHSQGEQRNVVKKRYPTKPRACPRQRKEKQPRGEQEVKQSREDKLHLEEGSGCGLEKQAHFNILPLALAEGWGEGRS